MTTTPAPEALIAEARKWASSRQNQHGRDSLVVQLAAALSASLPKPDACSWCGGISGHGLACPEKPLPRPDAALDGRTCSYCFKRPATAVDDDLDAISSECSQLQEDDPDDLDEILDGIDRTDDDRDGWWETSTGAEFGARKLAEVRRLLTLRTDMSPDHSRPGNVSTSGPETNTTDEEAGHGG